MAYDPEKYRDKREKVLGIRKKGLSFSSLSALVAVTIIAGISFVTIPGAVSYMKTRNLDDAIFKLDQTLPSKSDTGLHFSAGASDSAPAGEVITRFKDLGGVTDVITDKHGTRLIITFDRRRVSLLKIKEIFKRHSLDATLLNRVNHRQHKATQRQEAEIEAS